jgi:hypothetical protein
VRISHIAPSVYDLVMGRSCPLRNEIICKNDRGKSELPPPTRDSCQKNALIIIKLSGTIEISFVFSKEEQNSNVM